MTNHINHNVRNILTGGKLTPGINVDAINHAAGIAAAISFGYDTPKDLTVVELALNLHARGEEGRAQKTAIEHGIDLTGWYLILAHAIVQR